MAKKAATKKVATKKVAAKKAPAKKVEAPKKVASKAPAKKAAAVVEIAPVAPRAPAKKKAAATKKAATQTSIIARVDVGFGNSLSIRGEGGGLSWEKGITMECISSDEWAFKTKTAKTGIVFKFLINDEIWAEGEDLTVPAGGTSITSPTFA